MAETPVLAVENNFVNGLITEATGLDFPQSAVTDTFDCEFFIDGSVSRRNGFDYETLATTKTVDRTSNAVSSYLWQDVAGDGNVNVVVLQIGSTLYFYRGDDNGDYTTTNVSSTVTLTPVSGAPATNTVEAQYCDGNGLLFVTHPYCEPMVISYNTATNVATPTNTILRQRDFEGAINDPLFTPTNINVRPVTTFTTMDVNHLYNLINQGWTGGLATLASGANLAAWDTAQTTMPSNADVMWQFLDTNNNFSASNTALGAVFNGNTPAPNGSMIYPVSSTARSATTTAVLGSTATILETTTSFSRPSTCAFFSGRVFYAGIAATGFNAKIYFSQIAQNIGDYGLCYQTNDPTSFQTFDLLPSDGGVIVIQEAGTIFKLFTVPGGLCVFAANGVWFITGNQGIGFTANDYSVQKIANYATLSATSFVNVNGYPVWWTAENIYQMTASSQLYTTQGNAPVIQPLTYTTIKTFFDAIPLSSKRNARGIYQIIDGTIRWLYKSTSTSNLTHEYEFDRVLNFNTYTRAFYPWTISSSGDGLLTVNSIVSSGTINRPVGTGNVSENDLNTLTIDSHGNQIITFLDSGTVEQNRDKYIVSYPNSGSYKFTFAERSDTLLVDWMTYDGIGVNYTSFFTSGFKLRGGGIRKFSNNWVRIYSRLDDDVTYNFQSIWDFATTGSGTGRWSVAQQVDHDATNYSYASKRLKARGHGLAMQFKVTSVTNNDFDIVGWSTAQTAENAP